MKTKKTSSFFRQNGLSLALLGCFLLFWAAQAYTGWHEYNNELADKHVHPVSLPAYLHSGHFFSATFENWESEFFQMFIYIVFTISLRQQGSAESKSPSGAEAVDRPPVARAGAPWAVRKGGVWLKFYKNSLSLAFLLLFLLTFSFHAWSSYRKYSLEQQLDHKPTAPFSDYMTGSHFWFESMQNWQSEFLAVFSIVVLTIFLRQKGSPQSKPVDAPNSQTGEAG